MDQSVGGECGRPAHHYPHQILSLPGSQHQMAGPSAAVNVQGRKKPSSNSDSYFLSALQGIKMGSRWRRTTGSGRRAMPWLSTQWLRLMLEITQYSWATRSPKRSRNAPSSCWSTVSQVFHLSFNYLSSFFCRMNSERDCLHVRFCINYLHQIVPIFELHRGNKFPIWTQTPVVLVHHIETNDLSHSHSHLWTIRSFQLTSFKLWENTGEPRQPQGEPANAARKPGIEPTTFLLKGCSTNHCASVPPQVNYSNSIQFHFICIGAKSHPLSQQNATVALKKPLWEGTRGRSRAE